MNLICWFKVQLFWEGHKNLCNLPHALDLHNYKTSEHEEDCTNFCGLLRKAELYLFSYLWNLHELVDCKRSGLNVLTWLQMWPDCKCELLR